MKIRSDKYFNESFSTIKTSLDSVDVYHLEKVSNLISKGQRYKAEK